jgi:hypothetical protein
MIEAMQGVMAQGHGPGERADPVRFQADHGAAVRRFGLYTGLIGWMRRSRMRS